MSNSIVRPLAGRPLEAPSAIGAACANAVRVQMAKAASEHAIWVVRRVWIMAALRWCERRVASAGRRAACILSTPGRLRAGDGHAAKGRLAGRLSGDGRTTA